VAGLSLPVNDNPLSPNLAFWRTITTNKHILTILRQGYRLQLRKSPPLFRNHSLFRFKTSKASSTVIQEEVLSLLKKDAIQQVPPYKPAFFSTIFTVAKKELGKIAHCDQSQETEQELHERFYLPYANSKTDKNVDTGRRFPGVNRFEGRFPTCSGTPAFPQVSQLHMGRKGVPVQETSFWSIHKSQNLHLNDETVGLSAQDERHSLCDVFGRPLVTGLIEEGSLQISQNSTFSTQENGILCKSGKVSPRSVSETGISGTDLGRSNYVGLSTSGQGGQDQGHCSGYLRSPVCSLQGSHETHRSHQLCFECTQTDSCTSQSGPEGPVGRLQISKGPISHSKVFSSIHGSDPPPVTSGSSPCVYIASDSGSDPHHRCYPAKVGGHPSGSGYPLSDSLTGVDNPRISIPHQLERTSGYTEGLSTLGSPFGPKKGLCANGQHHSPVLHKELGRYAKFSAKHCSGGSLAVDGQETDPNHSIVHTDSSQCRGRLSQQGEDVTGLVPAPPSVQEDISQDLLPLCGPILLEPVKSLPPLFLPLQRQESSGSGCPSPVLELPRDVRFPAPLPYSSSSGKVSQHRGKRRPSRSKNSIASGPMLDQRDLAPPNPSHVVSSSQKTDSQETHSGPVHRQIPHSQRVENSKTSGISNQRRLLSKKGYSKPLIKGVEKSIRPSTLKTYEQAWKAWSEYNTRNRLELTSLSVNKLSEFLQYCYDVKHANPQTLNVYRSAISFFLQPDSSHPSSSKPLINRLMRSYRLTRPPTKKIFPPWHVSKLLNLLRSKSWSPARNLDLAFLTKKLAVLLALSSMKRISDLSLLSMEKGMMLLSRDSVTFIPKYGAKTDRPGSFMVQFSVYRNKLEPALCPILYLKRYLQVTQQFRDTQDNHMLFLSLCKKKFPVKTYTIASWVKQVISMAGASMSPGFTRNFSASLAVAKNVPLHSILSAGNWASVRTPSKHYFHVVVSQENVDQDAIQRAVLSLT